MRCSLPLALATAPLLHGDHAYAGVSLPGWWLLFVFLLGFAYPLRFEFRQQSCHLALETVPFVLGLLFLAPLDAARRFGPAPSPSPTPSSAGSA